MVSEKWRAHRYRRSCTVPIKCAPVNDRVEVSIGIEARGNIAEIARNCRKSYYWPTTASEWLFTLDATGSSTGSASTAISVGLACDPYRKIADNAVVKYKLPFIVKQMLPVERRKNDSKLVFCLRCFYREPFYENLLPSPSKFKEATRNFTTRRYNSEHSEMVEAGDLSRQGRPEVSEEVPDRRSDTHVHRWGSYTNRRCFRFDQTSENIARPLVKLVPERWTLRATCLCRVVFREEGNELSFNSIMLM